jgi:hypothetical protein
MDIRAVFGLSVLMSFVAFGLTTKLYILPRLRVRARNDALVALIVPHAFRFIGLSFLVPGVVSPSLPSAFAVPAALGDLVAAILAVAATLAVTRGTSWALVVAWVFNVWGTIDLLYAVYQGLAGIPGFDPRTLGAAFFIPTAIVPPYLILHGLIFWLLLRPRQ